jgi:hypothetical protein
MLSAKSLQLGTAFAIVLSVNGPRGGRFIRIVWVTRSGLGISRRVAFLNTVLVCRSGGRGYG